MTGPLPLDKSRRQRRRALLTLVAVALASGVVGAAIDRAFTIRRAGPPFGMPPASSFGGPGTRPPPEMRRRFSASVARELQLTETQRQAMDSILERQFVAMEALTMDVRPKLDSIVRAGQAEVDALLTPEQRERVRMMRERFPVRARPPLGP